MVALAAQLNSLPMSARRLLKLSKGGLLELISTVRNLQIADTLSDFWAQHPTSSRPALDGEEVMRGTAEVGFDVAFPFSVELLVSLSDASQRIK